MHFLFFLFFKWLCYCTCRQNHGQPAHSVCKSLEEQSETLLQTLLLWLWGQDRLGPVLQEMDPVIKRQESSVLVAHKKSGKSALCGLCMCMKDKTNFHTRLKTKEWVLR